MKTNTKCFYRLTVRFEAEAECIWFESSGYEPFHDTRTNRSCRPPQLHLPAGTQGIRNVDPIQRKAGGREDDD